MYTEEAQKMTTLTGSPCTDDRPEFIRIIESISNENANAQENVIRLKSIANVIKPFANGPGQTEPKMENASCLTDRLWEEINILRAINHETYNLIKHFESVIGN